MSAASLQTVLLATGFLTTALLSLRLLSFLHLYFIRRGTLDRYLHPGPNSTWALVTGASDGIGFATARSLRRRGFNVVLHGRNAEKLERCKRRLLEEDESAGAGKSVLCVVASATEAARAAGTVQRFVQAEVEGRGGKLTVLVNNIGGTGVSPPLFPFVVPFSTWSAPPLTPRRCSASPRTRRYRRSTQPS